MTLFRSRMNRTKEENAVRGKVGVIRCGYSGRGINPLYDALIAAMAFSCFVLKKWGSRDRLPRVDPATGSVGGGALGCDLLQDFFPDVFRRRQGG